MDQRYEAIRNFVLDQRNIQAGHLAQLAIEHPSDLQELDEYRKAATQFEVLDRLADRLDEVSDEQEVKKKPVNPTDDEEEEIFEPIASHVFGSVEGLKAKFQAYEYEGKTRDEDFFRLKIETDAVWDMIKGYQVKLWEYYLTKDEKKFASKMLDDAVIPF
jgi:hypothetical protein